MPGQQPGREFRQQPQRHRRHRGEQRHPRIEAGEHHAQRQHRAQVVDEAGGQNELADLRPVETGLHHHRVDHGNGGGGERDAGDLRLRPRPADDEAGERQGGDIRGEEADNADGDAGPELLAHHLRVDFGAGQEGQQDRAEAGEEIDPGSERQADDVARDGPDDDLGKGDGDADPDGQDRGEQSQPDPECSDQPNVIHAFLHASRRRGAAKANNT